MNFKKEVRKEAKKFRHKRLIRVFLKKDLLEVSFINKWIEVYGDDF